MSLALYRKYRPGSFAEVVGQEHVTEPLMQAIRNGKVHHAYLFSGPRGCGKTSSARILARSLQCEQGPTPTPCGQCDSCVALAPNGPGSLDVIEIDAASHGLIDDARDLRERAFFTPVSSRYKIYIIDEAHMVTTAAFNALLKLVEEPPPHLKFVFATTEPDKVIGTIRSRTHHYPFRLIPPRQLLGLVTSVCAQEAVEVEPQVLPLVVRAGAGSARDSLSVLDQLLAGAGPEGLSYSRALGLLGYTDTHLLDEVVEAIAAGASAVVFETVDRVIEGGHDPRRFVADLLERFRDLVVISAVPDAGDSGLIDAPVDQLDRLRTQAARFGAAELTRAGDILSAGLTEMRGATAPRLLLELLCARLLLPAAASDVSAMAARLDRLERRLELAAAAGPVPTSAASAASPAAATPAPAAAPAAASAAAPSSMPAVMTPAVSASPDGTAPRRAVPTETARSGSAEWPTTALPAGERTPTVAVTAAPVTADASAAGALDVDAVRRAWPGLLDAVKLRKRTAHALLSQYAEVADVRGKTLVLAFSTEPIRRQFAGSANEEVLVEALRTELGVEWRIEALSAVPNTAAGAVSGVSVSGAVPDAGPPAAAAPSWSRGAPSGGGGSPSSPTYDGFAPGDEAVDDESGGEPAMSPDEAAVALLQQGLGAKIIGEIDAT